MSTRSLLVSGVGGGVGTTAVTALVVALLRARGVPVTACDHSDGTLGQRIAADVPHQQAGGEDVQVTDAGRLEPAIADALEVPDFTLCLVSGAGVAPAQAGRAALEGLLERFGQQVRQRILIVSNLAATTRRRDGQMAREILHADVELPRSAVLGGTGPIRPELADKSLSPALDRLSDWLSVLLGLPTPPPDGDWPTRITPPLAQLDDTPTPGEDAPVRGAPQLTLVEATPRQDGATAALARTAPVPDDGAPDDAAPGTADAAPARAARMAPEGSDEWDDPVPTGQERARRGDGLH